MNDAIVHSPSGALVVVIKIERLFNIAIERLSNLLVNTDLCILDTRSNKRGNRRMADAAETKTAILDAAEAAFAAKGFDLVSQRDIAAKAQVPLGLINYHFGNKDRLFVAVVARRADELNKRRRQALAALTGAERKSIEKIVDAFLRPYLDLMLEGGPGWRAYGRLIAWAPSQRWTKLIARQFKETAELFTDAMIAAERRLAPELAARGYVHLVYLMVGLFAANDALETLFDGDYSSRDLRRSYQCALPFLVGAFQGLASVGDIPPPRKQRAVRTPRKRVLAQ
jgi:AcrR family transcriptional regulator